MLKRPGLRGYKPRLGEWIPNGKLLLIISIYAPQELSEKKSLWDYLNMVIGNSNGEVIIMGDFNEVRNQAKRYGSTFNIQGANAFNSFVSGAVLEEGFNAFVEKTWKETNISDHNAMTSFQGVTRHNKLESMEVAQKAKIKWAIEGNENILNKKRSQLAIRGILVDGSEFPNKLNLEQQMDLETNVTREEIKRAVWDCGVDKSPGSDGFTFGFYQRYWSFLEKYVEETIFYFVQHGTFPKGGNSSFIALIPKTHNANMVDFEKAYDSVRWDYLDYVLKNFGFGDTWRGWIQSCLKSLRGSVMVNGLRINMNKSKLMGIYVANNKVDQVAAKIGCETLKAPFSYLGLKVGDLISRIQTWNDMLNKFTARLSKWKMKTLSIGGRLMLLKSVLELNSKKLIWVKWSKVLASKDKGGLGISSLYALNRALLFKWVWRFRTQNSSLWARVIKDIHGKDGKLDNKAKYSHPSIWWDIVHEMKHLKNNVCGLAVESVFVILCGGRFGTFATRASLVRLFLRRHLYLKIWYLVPFIGLDIDEKRLLVG
ncbi:RNA-directed DNA polymerase, eukaryota, reverse transcriptase zinc-binding domain protein [Tanacetum coccineum]